MRNTQNKINIKKAEEILRLYYDCYSTGRIAEKVGLDRLDIRHFQDTWFDDEIWDGTISLDDALDRIRSEY